MNWFNGNIAEAVVKSKEINAIFVVFVEGKDAETEKIRGFLNEERIRQKLESDNFVAIKVEADSQAYLQFASIYRVVPVPSIFFIDQAGAPIEIGTGVIANADELGEKIDNVLKATGKNLASPSAPTAAVSAASFIAAEQQQAVSVAASSKTEPTKAPVSEEIICEDGVCTKKPKNDTAQAAEMQETVAAEPTLEETRNQLEQQRRARVEKERELNRTADTTKMPNVQTWQKENELKELKENIRRERMEERAVRDRIRAQIAADRSERRQRSAAEAANAAAVNSDQIINAPHQQAVSHSNMTRLQFRFPNGDAKINNFAADDTLGVVRDYVESNLIPGTGYNSFTLVTAYPKRELAVEQDTQTLAELELVPSAVILVIATMRSNPVQLIKNSGGFINILSVVFWTLMSPAYAVFGYFTSIFNRRDNSAGEAQKRAGDDQGPQQTAVKRRNMDRFNQGPSSSQLPEGEEYDVKPGGSSDAKPRKLFGRANVHRLSDNREDTDDENATWNGNSTQQQ